MKEPKPIGKVTHYYGNLGVAVVKFIQDFEAGERVRFKGATTDFEQKLTSIQLNHKAIQKVKKNQEVGVKVDERVREGDEVYLVE